METGTGAGGRQLRRAQAGRADADLDHGPPGDDRGPAAAGGGERAEWLRPGDRSGAEGNRGVSGIMCTFKAV